MGIINNLIYENDEDGVNIVTAGAMTTIVNNTIVGNEGDGIDYLDGNGVLIKNNIIDNNGLHGVVSSQIPEPQMA